MKLAFAQIDAFAERPFAGNPAVVIGLHHWLDDSLLQAIAAEHNVAETAFYIARKHHGADYELRWFSPACEVDLCGHATLASAHHIFACSGGDSVRFLTRKAGILTVRRAEEGKGAGYALTLPALRTSPARHPEAEAALGIKALEIESHRKGYHIFRLENETAVRAVTPDFRALAALGMDQFIITAEGEASDVVSRVFVPGAGIDEDHVTGSAHSALTPFWTHRLGRVRFSALQASARGGHISCGLVGDDVVLSGGCVTVIEGAMTLP